MIKSIKHLFLLITFLYVGMVQAQTTDLIYHLGSAGSTINIASVATDPSGNIYICGGFTGTNVEFSPLSPLGASSIKSSGGTSSGFIAAYDVNGTLKKVVTFGNSLVNKGLKVYVDPAAKNIYLLAAAAGSVNFAGGGFGSVAAGSGAMALVKYDKTLTPKTIKIFYNGVGNAGDILNDLAFYGTDLYVTGTLFTTAIAAPPNPGVEFNPGGATKILSSTGVTDIFIAKYDTTTLTNQWAHSLGGVNADAGLGIDLDNSGNIYLTGYFTGQNIDLDPTILTKTVSESGGGSSTGDAFVAKYNSLVECQWAFNIGAAQLDRGNDILVDKSNSTVYVGGITKKDALSVYFDPTTTATASFAGIGATDIFVASYTSAGAYNWHLATGSAEITPGVGGDDELTSLAFDLGGNIVLSGYTSGNVNFGNSKTITGLGGKDAYFAVISGTSGLASAAYNLGGASDEQANGVTVGSTGKYIVVGNYSGAGDYNLGAAVLLPISGTQDGFISRHVLCTPPTITGTLSTCVSSTTQLTGSGTAAASNAWVSATPAVATINSTGLVTGVAAGTSIITYTNNVGCTQTATVTVSAAPTITGTLTVCSGLTTTLIGSGTPDATTPWASATPTVATVSSTGVVTGVSAGTSIITYKTSNGCTKTATVTVNSAPTIIGTLTVCVGLTTTLTGSGTPDATTPWSSATTSVATVNSTGVVTGVAAGTSIITYTNNAGCTQAATVTVSASPTITGTLTVCVGSTTTLTGSGTPDATTPWASATTSVATVSSTGVVTGVSAGTSIVTYKTSAGCTKTATITVSALPTITGTLSTCSTTQLTGSGTAAASNPWVSGTPSVATVNSTGLVTGVAAGTSIITYTNNTGCTQTATVTITAGPTITGGLTTCIGSSTQLIGSGTPAASNAWVSATSAVASVSSTGLVSGVSVGTSIITYTNSTGCSQTATITVTPAPTITGTLTACVGSSTQLTGSGTAAASNAWVSSTPTIATVNSTGLVTGVAAGICVITYTNSNGCTQTAGVTITAAPTITGNLSTCSTSQLTGSGTAAASNPWVSATPSVATVNSTGLVTSVSVGTSVITYTNNAGCTQTATVTVSASPTITGTLSTCSTTQLTGSGTAAASNAWVSGTPSVATVNSTGLVTGVAAGTSIITYTNNAGCTQTVTVTINALPTITGTLSACIGSNTQLTGSGTAAASNAWVSATPSVATVSSTGLVTGVAAGTSIITYTNNTGCSKTATVTINALPTITGTLSACVGSTTQLTGSGTAAASNAWVSATPSVATVSSTGLVTGVAAGTSVITYTNSVGCTQTATVTVNALPTITGTLSACVGSTSQLTGSGTAAASNAWVSATPAVATVSSTGLVSGVGAGTSIITYTNNAGCTQTATVTVNSLPTITGTLSVCVSFTTQLTGSGTAAASNAWVSATPAVATVNSTGLVTGVSIGTSIITYTNSNGCTKTATISVTSTVTPAVSVSSSTTTICQGNSITFTANPTNGGTPAYKWKLGAGYISGETNATYTTTGAVNNDSYSVEMTSSSSCASPSVVTSTPVVITVNPTLVPVVTISTVSNTICLGDVITFTSAATNPGTTPSFVWRKNGVAIIPAATGTSYSTTGAVNGDVYSVVMTSNALCVSPSSDASNTISVIVNPLPSITGTTTVCTGSTITLTGSGTANASNPWISSTPAVATVTNTGVVTGVTAGTSIITYTNSNGCSETVTITVNATPTVTGTLSICVGSTTQLTGAGTAASSNPWISATSAVATVSNTGLVTGITAGTSVITYTTNTGCSKAVTVTVNAIPTITGTATVCVGSTTQLTGSSTADATSPWVSASPSIATVSNTGLVTGVAGGTSVITYQNSNGCTTTQTVTVNPTAVPGVSITANNSTICTGTSITFTATPTDGGTTPTYKWKLGSGYISGETNATYTTTTAVNGNSYSVEMTSNAICASTNIVNSNTIVITVTTSVTPTVTIAANTGNTICAGTPVTFTATPGNGGSAPTYQWKKNGSNISTATNATYTTSSLVNNDQISVDIVSNSTCASTFNASSLSITMVVNPVVTAIVALTASSTSVCSGTQVIFTASYTNEGTAPLFEWFVNNISQGAPGSSDTFTSSTLSNNDQVRVRMTSSEECVVSPTVGSNTITITVTSNVTPTVTIASNKTTICAGGSVLYTATPVNGGTASYQWQVDGANVGSATTVNTFTTSSLTDGNVVTVVLTSSITCVSSPTAISTGLTITVAPPTQIGSQPSDQSVCALGNNVTFSVGATGDNLSYQWKTGSTNLANNSTYSGVTTKDLSISNVSNADLLGYKVTITGTCGTLTSNVATLTQSTTSINITTQPSAQVLETGDMIQLSVSATGPTLSYQWKKNGVDLVNDSRISGANTASLQISNALVSDSDNNYTCLIMSPCAAQVSSNATSVTVTTATSTQDALTKGFVIAPNPSAGHFTLSNNYSPFVVEEIEIISMEGIVVARKTIIGTTSLNEEIFAQDLPKGMYLLVIKGEGEQALLKVVFDK